MQPSQNAINLIQESEGLRIKPYNDGAGYMTIGWGHRIKPGESFTVIDRRTATKLLLADTINAADCVNRLVTVPLNQNQFDALVDFTFNLGCQNLASSTLLKLLNQGNYEEAANEFDKWIYASGKVMNGLITRREREKQLFLTPIN